MWSCITRNPLNAMDKVAIVVLNWNGAEMLRRFMPIVVARSQRIAAPADEGNVSIYLADNGSTDDSVALVRDRWPTVRIIAMDQNRGFAEGYNVALRSVEAQYVVLLNSDVAPGEGWLHSLVAYMDAHPEVAACQPKVLSYRDPTHFEYAGAAGGFIDRYGYPFCRGRIMGTVEQDHGQYDRVLPVLWATGAALFIRLADYREVGGLDGRFFAHCEEIDLCWRLRSRGRGVVCVPQSVVHHVGAATLRRENPRKTYLNFRNNLLMLYNNLPDSDLHPVMRLRWWLDRLAALKFLLSGQASNALAVLRARRDFRRMRPAFQTDRLRNLSQTTCTQVVGRTSFSILWRYYVMGRKTFDALGQ